MNLRPYQAEAVDAVIAEWRNSPATLVVMPTGTGKTIVFAHIIDRLHAGRTMVLAHREELIHQAVGKIQAVTGRRPDIEMAHYAANEAKMFRKAPVVVSSIQTQIAGRNGGRMTRFDPLEFELAIVDEAHHAPAQSYRRTLDHYKQNPTLKILGVTATPDRADEEALGQVFGSVAYVYEILDAIRDGWLVPIQQRRVVVDGLDFSAIRTTAGDLNGKDLAAVMEYERNLHEIATPTIELTEGRRTLLFAASVAHAERLCEIFNRHKTGMARWICGKTPRDERAETLRDYNRGDFSILCNVGVFTEGYDEPGIETVVLARPTKSRALFAQMVGRGTRPLPGLVDGPANRSLFTGGEKTQQERVDAILHSDKPSLEVIDFVGNTGKHKLINTSDILGGNYTDDVIERAAANAATSATPQDVITGLEEAEAQIHEEKKKAREAERRRRALKAKARYETMTVDPFDVLDIEPQRERGWNKDRQPSEKMVACLEKFGVQGAGTLSFTEAKTLISTFISRREHGWCSYKQAKLLHKYGYPTKGVRFKEASETIDRIAKNNWRRPDPFDEPATVEPF